MSNYKQLQEIHRTDRKAKSELVRPDALLQNVCNKAIHQTVYW